jgi:hypothetical protein
MSSGTASFEPFLFRSRLHISELTGMKAANIQELLQLLREVPGSSIYHHTHRFLQQHQYLSPEPPNDFAHWVSIVLGDEELGERLASIDTVRFTTIRALREAIIATIEEYIKEKPSTLRRFAEEGEEFYFIKSVSFVFPAHYEARDLAGFADILKKISIDSIYYHMFESRLRLEKGTNDFSNWIENAIGDSTLAKKIARLDPYTHTMEDLRKSLIRMVEKSIGHSHAENR